MKHDLQLAQLLGEDIEIADQKITAEAPSSQGRLLMQSIDQVLSAQPNNEYTAKLFAIIQILLSGSYHFFDESKSIEYFKRFVSLAATTVPPDSKDSALTIASLLLNRVREQLAKEADGLIPLIDGAERSLTTVRQKALLTGIKSRVQASCTRNRTPRTSKFKIPELDLSRAADNVKEDIVGDWYQDPWGWPEVDWLGHKKSRIVAERLSNDSCGWTVPLDVMKRDGGVRPAILINPLDRVAFQALVDDLSLEAAADIPPWAHGWRLSRSHPQKGIYESNHTEWDQFSKKVNKFCRDSKFTAHLDIRSFFATVDTSRLLSQLGRRYRKIGVIDRLEAYFQAWNTRQNGMGIPQRSFASSVLAHAVLRPMDAYINRMSSSITASRWMDDIWLHGPNETVLLNCIKEIEGLLSEMRLSLNTAKTEIFPADQADKAVQLVDVYQDDDDEVDLTLSLEDLAARPPFEISKKIGRLLKIKAFASLDSIPEDRMQEFDHLARSLAKGFRVSGNWKRFIETYIGIVHSHVSAGNLSVASWGEMFPNEAEEAMKNVVTLFSKSLVDGPQRLLTPLAAQRLVAWSSLFGNSIIDNSDFGLDDVNAEPFKLRGIAFATLGSRALKEKAKMAISQADELSVEFLKDRDFDAPQLSARFESE